MIPLQSPSSVRVGGRLPVLDGLRGLAAIGVMFYHLHNLFGLNFGFERAYLFVDVFFMLSGFVLALAWEFGSAKGAATRTLLTARIRRLWPTIMAAAALGGFVHLFLGDTPHLSGLLFLALLMIPAVWQGGSLFPLNGPQWSLLWEFVANLAHALVLRRLGERRLLVVGIVMGIFFAAAVAACGGGAFGPNGNGWWLGITRVGWSYTIGILIARRYRAGRLAPILSWWQALSLPILAVLALPFLPLSVASGDTLFVIVLLPLMFWLLVTARQPGGARRELALLGSISFPLYAVHVPLLTLFAGLHIPDGAAAAMATIAALLLSIFVALRVEAASGKRVRRLRPA